MVNRMNLTIDGSNLSSALFNSELCSRMRALGNVITKQNKEAKHSYKLQVGKNNSTFIQATCPSVLSCYGVFSNMLH